MHLLFLTVQVMQVTYVWPKCDVVIYLKQEARDGMAPQKSQSHIL